MRRVLALFCAGILAVGPSGAALAEDVSSPHPPVVETPFRTALAARVAAAPDLATFYAQRGHDPVFSQSSAEIGSLVDLLTQADDHALPVPHATITALHEGLDRAVDGDAVAMAELEVLAANAFLTHLRQLAHGVLRPRDVDPEIGHRPGKLSAGPVLAAFAAGEDPARIAKSYIPQHPQYEALLAERRRLQDIIATDGWGATVPGRRALRPGRRAPAVTALRARLTRMGYGPLGQSDRYDDELLMTVKLFQAQNGLNADGVAGPATLNAANVSPARRLAQVLANIERARWLNRELGARHVFVNLADYSARLMEDGVERYRSRAVIGETKRDSRTPEFSDEMTHIVVNPYWHVPSSIAEKEYLPLLKEDPMALAKRGMQLRNRRGQILNTENGDFSGFYEGYFPFYIKQPPGPRNALGRVKFMFPNHHNIYLHDTPAKKLFARDWRAYSHGCVRLQRPFDLAYVLLESEFEAPIARFNALLRSKRERYVYFKEPVPVHISYHTAFVTDGGDVVYRNDVYGRDRRIASALKRAGVNAPALDG